MSSVNLAHDVRESEEQEKESDNSSSSTSSSSDEEHRQVFRESIRQIFEQLDANQDGTIDRRELIEGLRRLRLPSSESDIRAISIATHAHFAASNNNNNNNNNSNNKNKNIHRNDNNSNEEEEEEEENRIGVTYENFENFVLSKQHQLLSLFKELDTNKDGLIGFDEIKNGLVKYYYNDNNSNNEHQQQLQQQQQPSIPGDAEILHMLQRMDKDGNSLIDYSEWCDFLMLFPMLNSNINSNNAISDGDDGDDAGDVDGGDIILASLSTLFHYWQKSSAIDIGESIAVPDELPIIAPTTTITTTTTSKTSDLSSSTATATATNTTATATTATNAHWKFLTAGAVAGAVSRTATAPLDRLKLLLQVQGMHHSSSSSSSSSGGTGYPPRISGIWDGLVQIGREGGFRAYFRGNGTNVIKIAPETGAKFLAYERYKALLLGADVGRREITTGERFVAGSLAGVTSQVLIYPLECIKTRLAVAPRGTYSGIVDVLVSIVRHEGFLSIYRGLVPSIIGVIPYAGIDLAVYETLKKMYINYQQQKHQRNSHNSHTHNNSDTTGHGHHHGKGKALAHHQYHPSPLVCLACGTISSTAGQLVSYPLALVRTRLQAQGLAALKAAQQHQHQHPQQQQQPPKPPKKLYMLPGLQVQPHPVLTMASSPLVSMTTTTTTSTAATTTTSQSIKQMGMVDMFKDIVRTEGLPGLYKGLVPNFLKVAPAVGISYIVYEFTKKQLGVQEV